MTQKELQLIQFVHMLNNPLFVLGLALFTIWVLAWSGIALWKAGRNNQPVWFIVLLLVHTAGILDIIYIFFFANKKEKTQ